MHKHKEEGREVSTKQAAYKIQLDFYFPFLPLSHALLSFLSLRFAFALFFLSLAAFLIKRTNGAHFLMPLPDL